MKKLLVAVSILAMGSFAHADLILSVNGQPAPDEILLTTSEIITLDIQLLEGQTLTGAQIEVVLSNA